MRLLILFLLTAQIALAQERNTPKLIKEKSEYYNRASQTTFPKNLEGFYRKAIYSFSHMDDDFEVTYENPDKSAFAIRIYSSKEGYEGRLRKEYLKTLQDLVNESNKDYLFHQGPVQKSSVKYICNGFKAIKYSEEEKKIWQIVIFECGGWFLKITLRTMDLDTSGVEKLTDAI